MKKARDYLSSGNTTYLHSNSVQIFSAILFCWFVFYFSLSPRGQGFAVPQSHSERTHLKGIVALMKISNWFHIHNNFLYYFFLMGMFLGFSLPQRKELREFSQRVFYRRERREESFRRGFLPQRWEGKEFSLSFQIIFIFPA